VQEDTHDWGTHTTPTISFCEYASGPTSAQDKRRLGKTDKEILWRVY